MVRFCVLQPEADLGMFGVFSGTGPPYKKGAPTGRRMLDSKATFSGPWVSLWHVVTL